jgi:flagellar M-ring protein FliF
MSDNPSMNELLSRFGGSQRVIVALVGLGALAAIWGFAQWGMSPGWVPVASGLPLERISQATQRLDEEGIAYRLERGGSAITVEEPSAARARVVLAANGIGGGAGRPGFELFDQPSWGMTDFTQRVNYRRALEGELERTIGHMRGVESAQVHLALQESSFLKSDDRPSEASVVLEMGASEAGQGSVVEGVQFLVASAVEGLAPENVMVLDDRGRLLSAPDDNGGIGLSNRQLQVQRQVEGYLQSKAEVLVEQMVGPRNATVRVSAELNFDQIETTTQGINPDQQTLVSEDRSEITPGTADQGASQTTSNIVYETARSVETLSRGGARLQRLTVAVVLGDRRVEGADGAVTYEARTAQETQRIESVVKNAVGFSPERGDEISVVSVPPEGPEAVVVTEAGPDLTTLLLAYQKPIVALFGTLTALFLALRVLGSLKGAGVRPAAVLAGAPAGAQRLETRDRDPELAAATAGAAAALPNPARAPAVVDPDMTARVVRAWMKE